MKSVWYQLVKSYITVGLAFYYKKIIIRGKENIPKNKAVMFIANHPNALIDPLLIATNNSRNTHYLTRAGVFNNPIVKKLLSSINMIPVYRTRDGIGSRKLKSSNEEIFAYCHKILDKKEAILIFPEGSHNIQRRIRPFRKGFARIIFGAMDKHQDLEVDIIPVGLNYSDPEAYASKVSIIFGKPISAKPYWKIKDRVEAIQQLRKVAFEQLKLISNHIEDADKHDDIVRHFNKEEFLYPEKTKQKLKSLHFNDKPKANTPTKPNFSLLLSLVKINSIFPLQVWQYIQPKIKEKEFTATFKFAIGITAFPIFYSIQSLIVSYFFGPIIGTTYLIISFLSTYILTKTKK